MTGKGHQAQRKTLFWIVELVAGLAMVASTPARAQYQQTNLVSDLSGQATNTDTNCGGFEATPCLANPWGIVASGTSPFWISDNHTGFSTLYNGAGTQIPLVVTIPPPTGGSSPASPTGIVFNSTTEFTVSEGANSGAALFIFDTEDGTISGWNPTVDRGNAILMVDNSVAGGIDHSTLGAVYKGLAIGNNGAGNFIYAANFSDGVVEMYDGSFGFVKSFTDPHVEPDAASPGFAPFGIRNINGLLFVTFAMQDSAKHDDVAGPGLGFIDVFDMSGNFLGRLATGGKLNSPWGLALAPDDFGPFSGRLLVGNFGDGHINAYRFFVGSAFFKLIRAVFVGQLRNAQGSPITIEGLWGLTFGNGAMNGNNGQTNELFFTAGIQHEDHGLFGKLTFTPAAASSTSRTANVQR